MSNEITSILQPFAPQHRTPGQARSAPQPTVVDKSATAQGDRLSLTDSARLLQLAQSKPGHSAARGAGGDDSGMSYARTEDGFRGKGVLTGATGRQQARDVTMPFDPQLRSAARQVSVAGQHGAEVARSTEAARADKSFEAVTRRTGVQGNGAVGATQLIAAAETQVADSSAAAGSNRLPIEAAAQRPTPAMSNMMQAFYTTADMEGFDASSDLNADGVINFQDLAALKAREMQIETPPPGKVDANVHNITESFFATSTEQGFDAASDFNDDGVINFQDLAILRAKMEGS